MMMESFEHTYADLQPLRILDDDDDDDKENQQVVDSSNDSSTDEGSALTPVKEDIAPRDLHSYFQCKGKLLFDEPDGLPIIEVEVQPGWDDFFTLKRKPKKPSARASSSRQKQLRRANPKSSLSRKKKSLERTISCRSCDRKFATLRHMKIHAATHSRKRKKPKNFCRLCRRMFRHGGALAGHMRSHKKKKIKGKKSRVGGK